MVLEVSEFIKEQEVMNRGREVVYLGEGYERLIKERKREVVYLRQGFRSIRVY